MYLIRQATPAADDDTMMAGSRRDRGVHVRPIDPELFQAGRAVALGGYVEQVFQVICWSGAVSADVASAAAPPAKLPPDFPCRDHRDRMAGMTSCVSVYGRQVDYTEIYDRSDGVR